MLSHEYSGENIIGVSVSSYTHIRRYVPGASNLDLLVMVGCLLVGNEALSPLSVSW